MGYFTGNIAKTNLYNSYNLADCVVNELWYFGQLTQRPDRDTLTGIRDLDYAFAHGENPFPPERRRDSDVNSNSSQMWIELPGSNQNLYGDVANYRRWSRLALWYPTLYTGTGGFDHAQLGLKPVNFTPYADNPAQCADNAHAPDAVVSTVLQWSDILKSRIENHSYMHGNPLSHVWPAYKQLVKIMDGK